MPCLPTLPCLASLRSHDSPRGAPTPRLPAPPCRSACLRLPARGAAAFFTPPPGCTLKTLKPFPRRLRKLK
eukprot:72834-Chlamydomonas_euryale.AAC.2